LEFPNRNFQLTQNNIPTITDTPTDIIFVRVVSEFHISTDTPKKELILKLNQNLGSRAHNTLTVMQIDK